MEAKPDRVPSAPAPASLTRHARQARSRQATACFARSAESRIGACAGCGLGVHQHRPHLPPRVMEHAGDGPNAQPVPFGAANLCVVVHPQHPAPPARRALPKKADPYAGSERVATRVGPFYLPISQRNSQ